MLLQYVFLLMIFMGSITAHAQAPQELSSKNNPTLDRQNALNCNLAASLLISDPPNFEAAEAFIAEGASVNGVCLSSVTAQYNGANPVQLVAKDSISILGATVESIRDTRILAGVLKRIRVLQFLLEHNVNPNLLINGRTPLSLAVQTVLVFKDEYGDDKSPSHAWPVVVESLVEMLVRSGAKPNRKSFFTFGNTDPLMRSQLKALNVERLELNILEQLRVFRDSSMLSEKTYKLLVVAFEAREA